MSIGITIESDALSDLQTAVETLGGAVTGRDVMLVMGRAAQQVIKEHFEKIAGDSAHHESSSALGAERSGFYERAANAVQAPQLESDGVVISIEQQGLAQRIFGGDIEPVNAKFLTIPARAETYGHRAKEFENLRFILFPSGAGALVAADGGGSLRGARGGRKALPSMDALGSDVYFWLVKQVHQEPDPTVLPSDEEILDPAIAAAQSYVERVWERIAA